MQWDFAVFPGGDTPFQAAKTSKHTHPRVAGTVYTNSLSWSLGVTVFYYQGHATIVDLEQWFSTEGDIVSLKDI